MKLDDKKLVRAARWLYDSYRMILATDSSARLLTCSWSALTKRERNYIQELVKDVLATKRVPDEPDLHDRWCATKRTLGWKYGRVHDARTKTSPFLRSYKSLSKTHRLLVMRLKTLLHQLLILDKLQSFDRPPRQIKIIER